MPRRLFLAAAAPAGLVSAAVPLALGYLFGSHLEPLLEALGTARWVLLAAFVAVVVWWLVRQRP